MPDFRSERSVAAAGRAFAPDFRSANRPRHRGFDREAPGFRPKPRSGFAAETSVDDRGFKPKSRSSTWGSSRNFGAARPKLRLHGADFAVRRPPDERSCGRDGPVTYRSSTERVCPRVVPKGRADRDRNGQTPHARAPAGADVMPVGRVSAAPIARSLCRSGVRTTLRARGRLQAVAAGA